MSVAITEADSSQVPAVKTSKPVSNSEWDWTIGAVVGCFGILGEMKVKILTDFPERFKQLKKVCLRLPTGSSRIFEVKNCRPHKGQMLVRVVGIDKIEQAEIWRNALVQVRRSDAVVLPKDDYYSVDLVGMEVVTKEGRALGKLTKVIPNPGHDLLAVGDVLIPAVKQIVIEIDTSSRIITVDPPEGLLPGQEAEDVGEQL